MLIAGVLPPELTTGAVPVTDVTVPTLVELPSDTATPLIVIDEFVNPLLGMLLNVFVAPLIDLFVSVSVVLRPTKVVVASGNVIT